MTGAIYEMKADLFKSLAHPARIRVLELLSLRPHSVSELLDQMDVTGPYLSQQLTVLRQADVVTVERDGSERIYAIAQPTVVELLRAAKKFLLLRLASTAATADEIADLRYGVAT